MTPAHADPEVLASEIKAEAARLGLDLVGVVDPAAMDPYAGIDVRYWEIRRPTGRPADDMPGVKSIVVVGLRFWDGALDLAAFDAARREWTYPGYALMAARRHQLAAWLLRRGLHVGRARSTLSLKRLAVLAGFGTFGKSSLVLHPEWGPNFRVASLLTDAVLQPDVPAAGDPCGECVLCLEACPMGALEPYVVDPESCLVSLTLRQRAGDMSEVDPAVLRRLAALDRDVYEPRWGPSAHRMCRVCQDVCPRAYGETFPARTPY